MKKAVIILVLVALTVAPVAAFEVKGVGIDMSIQNYGFPLQANVTFKFSEKSSATASVGYTIINVGNTSIMPTASVQYDYKIIDGMFDLNVGAIVLSQAQIRQDPSDSNSISIMTTISVGTSYDFNIGSQSFTAWIDAFWGLYTDIVEGCEPYNFLFNFPLGIIGLTYNF